MNEIIYCRNLYVISSPIYKPTYDVLNPNKYQFLFQYIFFKSWNCSLYKTCILWPLHSACLTVFSLYNILFIYILSREARSSLGMKEDNQLHNYLSIFSHSFIHSTTIYTGIQSQPKQLLRLASSCFQSRGEDKYGIME